MALVGHGSPPSTQRGRTHLGRADVKAQALDLLDEVAGAFLSRVSHKAVAWGGAHAQHPPQASQALLAHGVIGRSGKSKEQRRRRSGSWGTDAPIHSAKPSS